MKIPDFPKRDGHTMEDTILDLMDSIAKEEKAIAHLLDSESKKIEAFVGCEFNFPTTPTNQEILHFNKSIHRIVEAVLMKEWLLYKKLETVIGVKEDYDDKHNTHCEQTPK